jgi:hypothetical protein
MIPCTRYASGLSDRPGVRGDDCQRRPQTGSATKSINPDSWKLDVAGVNRHLLEIGRLTTSNCLIKVTVTRLRLPAQKNLWLVHRLRCLASLVLRRRGHDDEETQNNHWWQCQPCERCQYGFYVGDEWKQRQPRALTGAVGESRWSCIRCFQKAGNCKVGLSNRSGLTRLPAKATKTRPRRGGGHDRIGPGTTSKLSDILRGHCWS